MSIYGYIYSDAKDISSRVSELKNIGVPEDCIYSDAGLQDESIRPALKKLKKRLVPGDTLYIRDFSDIGCTFNEMLGEWLQLTRELEVNTVMLRMPIFTEFSRGAETVNTADELASEFLEFGKRQEEERLQRRRDRLKQKIEAAKARGVKFGKKPSPLPDEFYVICSKFLKGEMKYKESAAALGMKPSTFYYRAMKYREEIVGTDRNRKEGTVNDGK